MSKTLLQFVTFLPKQLYSHLFLPRMWHAVVLGVIALLLSLLLALKYLFVPNLENLQAQAEAELSSVLGAPAHIDGFHAEWGSQGILIRAERVGLNPAISGAKSNLELKNISASIQTLPLLWGSLRFAWLDVGELDAIVAYSAAQKWHIPGLAQANKTDRAGLKWLLAQENIRVQTIGLRILDPEQHFFANPEHSMTLNQFVIENRAWRHAVSLKHQHVAVAAQFSHAVLDSPEAYEKWQGQGFIQTDKLAQNIAVWLRAEDNETRLLAKTPQLDFVKLQSDLASVSSAFSPRVLAAFSDTLTPQAWLKMHEVQGLLRDTQLETVFSAISELRNKQAFTPKLVNLSTGFDALSATGLAPAPIVQWSGAVQLVAHSTEKILAQRENNERRWSVDVTKLDWRSPDFAGQASLQANDIGGEHPLMTAQLVVQDLPIKTALAWLPKSSLSEWMNKALQADTLQGGAFKTLNISLKDSRKDNLKENLKIQAEVSQASFDFSPTSSPGLWPALVNLDAKLEYKNQQISWSEAKANTLGVGLTAASGRYDLEKLILQMEAKASASPPQLLAYMNIVPVEKIKRFAQTIQDQIRMSNTLGVLSSQFSFKADLNEKKASPLKFNAEMQWLAPSVSLSNFNGLALEKLDLKAAVSERGLNIESLNALAFGQPLSVTGKLDEQGMGQFRLTGRTEIKRIAEAVPYTALALLKTALVGADGVMGFDAQINQNTQGQNLLISSDLRDVSFNIPSILQKTKGNVLPLQFNAQLNNVQSSKTNSLGIKKFSANANLGAQIQAQFEGIVDSKTGLQVQRGGLAIGQNSVLNVPDTGIATHIALPNIDADTLIDRYSKVISESIASDASTTKPTSNNVSNTADFLPSSIAFESADVKLGGRHFLNVYAGANRTQNVWAVSLGADQIRGYLSWQAPDPQQKRGMVTALFDELSIPESEIKSLSAQISKIQTQSLPAVQLSVKQFNCGGRRD